MEIRTSLQHVRQAKALSVAELARRVGVSRQTIYTIEDGGFVPNTTIALRLARVLEVSVEELFSLDPRSDSETVEAELLGKSINVEDGQLVGLCRVNGRLMAAPVPAFPAYLPPADGALHGRSRRRVSVVREFDPMPPDNNRLLLAGCDPALSLLSEALGRSGIEIMAVPCASRRALEWLKKDRVHAAGSHLLDAATGDYNLPAVKRLFPKGDMRVVTFAVWEQGLVLAHGNPKSIRGLGDVGDKGIKLINREKGSGSRDLLDKGLRAAGIAPKSIAGYERLAVGHLSAAYSVVTGAADCCVATRSAARRFGLDFLPLAVERFDLSFSKRSLDLPAVKALLDLLSRGSLRRTLQAVAGYDTAKTGQVLM